MEGLQHNRRYDELAAKWQDGTISPEERAELENWFNTGQDEPIEMPASFAANESEQAHRIMTGIKQKIAEATPVHAIKRNNRKWWRIAAAAVLFFALAGGTFFMLRQTPGDNSLAGLPQQQRFKNDIDPANEGVVLTTNNGKKIGLDSISNGLVPTDENIALQKTKDALAYSNANNGQVYYHTIATNKGKDYHLTLADGTAVWLDALSSIHFPTAFPGKERIVEITGQAYFEVAKDATKPFYVRTGGQTIEVLGTHFNVNAHHPAIRTTLLEGSVRITHNKENNLLKPGEQAVVDQAAVTIKQAVDMDEVMAWKNGKFYFDGATVEEIMQQVSRWYDIDVRYTGNITETFVADLPRNLPVSRLLTLLEMTKQIEFVIDGNKVTVLPPPKK